MVIVRLGAFTGSEKVLVVDAEALSDTRTVKVEDPAMVGVPDITPPANARPGGRDPLDRDQVYGGDPPDALSPCE